MKKYLSSLLISFVLIVNLLLPISVFAADPTIKLTLYDEKLTPDDGLVSWILDIKTTNIPDGKAVSITLYEDLKNITNGYTSAKISGNAGVYITGRILKPGTKYKIKASFTPASATFEKTTIGETPKPPVITNDTDTYWFTNMDKDWMGTKGKLKLPGFTTSAECETARSDHWGGPSSNPDNKPCFVATEAEVLAEFEVEKKKNVTIPGATLITGKQIAAGEKYDPIYHLLAPIAGFSEIKTDDIGGYFSKIFLIAIGLCGALAVIMFVIGGIEYMGDESIWAKTKGKEQMTGAILGLLIALGSWALLNTINPDLLGGSGLLISSANIVLIDKPDAGDNTVDPDFNKGNESYSTSGAVSSGVTEVVSKLKNGSSISSFNVSTSSKTMIITMSDGSLSQSVPIDIGLGGVSEIGKGVSGDNKTPKGNWKILEVRTSAGGKPVFNKKGSNMGASFWLLSPTTNGDRGIGMHGNKNGTLPSITNGCIRLKNSDILALLPYIKSGISVNIQ